MDKTDVFAVSSFLIQTTPEPEGLVLSITDTSGSVHSFWLAELNWAELSSAVGQAFALMKNPPVPPRDRPH